jgi:hypothetical protein
MNALATHKPLPIRLMAALGAMVACCYLVWLGLWNVRFYHPDYALLGPLAVYLAYVASRRLNTLSRHDLWQALGGACLVVAGSLVFHSLYLWYRHIEVIPYSTNSLTTRVELSQVSALARLYLAPALTITLAVFEFGRAHFSVSWRRLYIALTSLGLSLFAIHLYLRFG